MCYHTSAFDGMRICPLHQSPHHCQYSVPTSDGAELHIRRLPTVGPRRGAALLLHAMMVDSRSMDRPKGAGFASYLASQGWDVHLADFRGHGQSTARGSQWSYHDLVREDVPRLIAGVKERVRGPVVAIGHSLGGHVCAASVGLGLCSVDALVGVATNIWLPTLEEPSYHWVKGALTQAMVGVSLPKGRFPSRALGVGPADEAMPYVRDLRQFWVEDRWGPVGGPDYLSALSEVRVPSLWIMGSGDGLLARPTSANAWASRIPGGERWMVGGGAHGLKHAPGHMDLITSQRSWPMWQRMERWMVAAVD